MTWREDMEKQAASCRVQFDANARREVTIFEEGMSILASVLRVQPRSLQQRAVLLILAQYFQLLLASWEELRAGRLSAALGNERSVLEAYEYGAAASMNARFAKSWIESPLESRTVKVEEARRRARDEFEKIHSGLGKDFASRHGDRLKSFQDLAHVTPIAAVGVIGKRTDDPGSFPLSPGGSYSPLVRAASLRLVWTLPDLISVAVNTFETRLPTEWGRQARAYVTRVRPVAADLLSHALDASVEWMRKERGGPKEES